MADQLGRAVTFTSPPTADFRELLLALYTWFNTASDPNWSIDGTVTRPTMIASAGDTGFAIVNVAGDQVLIADHAGVGGVLSDGTAINSSDDLMVGFCPGGGCLDMSSGGWTVGARWTGWCPDAQGPTYTSLAGRLKVASGATWISVRFKQTAGLGYTGAFSAGVLNRADSGLGDAMYIMAGLLTDFALSSATEHCRIEMQDGLWEQFLSIPANIEGLTGDQATDGVSDYRTTGVFVGVPNGGTMTSTAYKYAIVGALPWCFCSANGTIAKDWRDSGANVIGYNMDGGCWVALDDGTDAE